MEKHQKLIETIRAHQVRNMKFPPDQDRFYLDLGLFLIYYKRIKPEVPLALVQCEFLGLAEIHEEMMGIVVLARFDLEEVAEPVLTKGYLLSDLEGNLLYDSVPSKGEPMDIEVKIPEDSIREEDGEIIIQTMQGRYHEEFLPLICTKFL